MSPLIPLEGDEGIRFLIGKGYTDEEIVETLMAGAKPPDPTQRRRALLEDAQRVRGTVASQRPRLVPDPEAAIRDAVRALRKSTTRLTWENAATWMRVNTPGCETITEKTLRTWAKEDRLPSLSDSFWR